MSIIIKGEIMNLKPEDFAIPERIDRLRTILEKRRNDVTVVLENINDPHNMSACIRSCDATGISKIHTVYHSGQPVPKLGNKSSASARKWVDTIDHLSVKECFESLRKEGKQIYTTHMSADAISLYDIDFSKPTAIVFGNEHSGVSEEALSLADGNFLIPQVGMIQSLNISVACAVSVYEMFRQGVIKGVFDNPTMTEEEIDKILMDWVRR